MLKMKLLAVVSLFLAMPVFAGSNETPRVDQRELNQQKRIDQGVKSGALTDREAAALQKGQARVDTMAQKAKADGIVTPQERQRLHAEQNQQNRRIQEMKHNRAHK